MLSVIRIPAEFGPNWPSFLRERMRERETLVICPGPAVADQLREDLQSLGFAKIPEVITIAKFTKDELAKRGCQASVSRKSELLLEFAVVWRNFCAKEPDARYEHFIQAYDLLTDLRGLTTDLAMVPEVLGHYDPLIAKAVAMFWVTLDHLELLDEHAAYRWIARHTTTEDIHQRTLIFVDFANLSGVQVDMLKELAQSEDVWVPLPERVLQATRGTDWITWLMGAQPPSPEKDQTPPFECPVVRFQEGRLSETLAALGKSGQLIPGSDIVLGTKRLAPVDVHIVPLEKARFKVPANIFSVPLERSWREIQEFLAHGEVAREEFNEFLSEKMKKTLESARVDGDFRSLKVWPLWIEALQFLCARHGAPKLIGDFEARVIRDVAHLNSPRVSALALLSEEGEQGIKGLEQLSGSSTAPVALCLSSFWPPLKSSSGTPYPEAVAAALASLGPLRRQGLEFAFLKEKMLAALSSKGSMLLLEQGLEHEDLGVRELMTALRAFELPKIKNKVRGQVQDVLASEIKKSETPGLVVSASRLQQYLDCPRKYYFNYLDDRLIKVEPKEELLPHERGEIEHAVIAAACGLFKKISEWDEAQYASLVRGQLERHLKVKGATPPALEVQGAFVEVSDYARTWAKALIQLRDSIPNCEMNFEERLEGRGLALPDGNRCHVRGSIDCMVRTPQGIGVLDFKRTNVPAPIDFTDFRKIQLPFYLTSLKAHNVGPVLFWGHLSLSEPESSSLFWTEDSESVSWITVAQDLFDTHRVKKLNLKMGHHDYIEQAEEKLALMIENLINEKTFAPAPSSSKECNYCALRNLCPKGEA